MITWHCHVCGRERPDDAIGVHRRHIIIGTRGMEITENIRYCRDKADCTGRVEGVSFIRPRWQCEDCKIFVRGDVEAYKHCDEAKHSLAVTRWALGSEVGMPATPIRSVT